MGIILQQSTRCIVVAFLMSCLGCQWVGEGNMDISVADMVDFQVGPQGRKTPEQPASWLTRHPGQAKPPAAKADIAAPSSMTSHAPEFNDPIDQAVASLQNRVRNRKQSTSPPPETSQEPTSTPPPAVRNAPVDVAVSAPVSVPVDVAVATAAAYRHPAQPVATKTLEPPVVQVSLPPGSAASSEANPLRGAESSAGVPVTGRVNPLR
jgi:hypothetical protein